MKDLELNNKRIYYLDFMRGLAIFFMVMQHTMLVHEFTSGEGVGLIGNIFLLLGTAPAAPVFMFIMGLFIMKSKSSTKDMCIRGCKLLLLGYGLNLFRFLIPMVIAGEGASAVNMFFSVDILQLAGLSMIMASVLRKLTDNKYVIPCLVIGVLLVSPYLWGVGNENPLTDLLWGTSGDVAFPFLPWCIYPMLGMYLSKYLVKRKIDKKVKRNLAISAAVLGIIGLLTLDIFPYADYSRYGLGASFLVIAFVFIWLIICEYITNRFMGIRESGIGKLLAYWSEHVTNLYIIQWVIYGWSMLVLGANAFHGFIAMIIGLIVMCITHLLLRYTKITKLIPKV